MSLLNYLPESYQSSPETVDLLQSMGQQTNRLYDRYLDFLNQLQVCTASWGLSFWEQIYGIPTDISKPEQERREVLYSKMRAIGSVTPEMIRNIAAAFSEGEPAVTEFPSEYRFTVSVAQSLDHPTYLHGWYTAIEEMKPAHLQAGYAARYLPICLEESKTVFLKRFGIKTSFWNGFGNDSILLNGTHKLDGAWLFDQSAQGIQFYQFDVMLRSVSENHFQIPEMKFGIFELQNPHRIQTRDFRVYQKMKSNHASPMKHVKVTMSVCRHPETLSGNLSKHDRFYLDGDFLLDGSKTLSGGITEEAL